MKTQYPYRRQTISNQQTPGYRSERSERKNLGKNESGIILNESTQFINGSTHSLHGSSTIPKLIISLVINQVHEKYPQISHFSQLFHVPHIPKKSKNRRKPALCACPLCVSPCPRPCKIIHG